jgi:V-type H+-transporting ATPase subunit G
MLQSRGISDLLVAEKKAQDMIEEARKRKNKRIKDAQNEAKSEIEHFKGERDGNYKSLEQQVGFISFIS